MLDPSHTRAHAHAHARTCTCIRTFACLYARALTWTRPHVRSHTNAHSCTHTHLLIHTHVHLHTHKRTSARSRVHERPPIHTLSRSHAQARTNTDLLVRTLVRTCTYTYMLTSTCTYASTRVRPLAHPPASFSSAGSLTVRVSGSPNLKHPARCPTECDDPAAEGAWGQSGCIPNLGGRVNFPSTPVKARPCLELKVYRMTRT
jgi:hypothetical protein